MLPDHKCSLEDTSASVMVEDTKQCDFVVVVEKDKCRSPLDQQIIDHRSHRFQSSSFIIRQQK